MLCQKKPAHYLSSVTGGQQTNSSQSVLTYFRWDYFFLCLCIHVQLLQIELVMIDYLLMGIQLLVKEVCKEYSFLVPTIRVSFTHIVKCSALHACMSRLPGGLEQSLP